MTRVPSPSPGTDLPVTIPGDLVLVRTSELAVWAGAVTAWREGFEFTLLILREPRVPGPAPNFMSQPGDPDTGPWISIEFADGRASESGVSINRPPKRQDRLGLELVCEESTGHLDYSRWRVTPLPPPGAVTLTLYLRGAVPLVGSGAFDGAAITNGLAGSSEGRFT